MTPRTDRYPLKAPQPLLDRMAHCDQVHPTAARGALRRGRLVFGLCPDMKWRRVEHIIFHRSGPTDAGFYHIFFAPIDNSPSYHRVFTRNGILLVEQPSSPVVYPADLTGD